MNSSLFRLILLPLALLAAPMAQAAAVLSVVPGTLSHPPGTPGLFQLQITNLNAGESVLVEEFLDVLGNGTVDATMDPLVQSFTVTDGQVPTIGGVRDINRPGDDNPAAGAITVNLGLYSASELNQLSGQYIFRVTPSSTGVPLALKTLTVNQVATGGSISGTVAGGGPAVVVALKGNDSDGYFVAGTVASVSGAYTLYLPAGAYQVLVGKTGFVDNMSTAPVTTVGASGSVTRNLTPIAATKAITGKVIDDDTGAALAGVQMFADSTNGTFAITSTDANGLFSLPVAAGVYKVHASEKSLPLLGYLRTDGDDGRFVDVTTLSGGSRIIRLRRGTAMVYGTVRDDSEVPAPVPFAGMEAGMYSGGNLRSGGFTDANGTYSLLAVSDNGSEWEFDGVAEDFASLNLLRPYTNNIYPSEGMSVRVDFVAPVPTTTVSGKLVDSSNTPVVGARLNASNQNGQYESSAVTGTDGSFVLSLIGGFWNGWIDNQDGLAAKGLVAPSAGFPAFDGVPVNNVVLIAPKATLTITGRILNPSGAPLPNVQVYAYTSSSDSQTNYDVQGMTDANGNYRLGVFNSTKVWTVSVESNDLNQQGYGSLESTDVLMNGASKVVNFTPQPPPYTPGFGSFGVAKGRLFEQKTGAAPTSRLDQPFGFAAFSDYLPAGSWLVRPPAGPNRVRFQNSQGKDSDLEAYLSLADLNTSAPNGTYTVTLNTYSNGQRSATLALNGDAYPNAPHVLNFDGLQQLGTGGNFVLGWDPFAGANSNDGIQVSIEDDRGNEVFNSGIFGFPGALNGTATSVSIDASLLTPGTTYRGRILFAKVVGTASGTVSGVTGVAAYFAQTIFPLGSVYQPDVASLGFFKGESYRQAGVTAPALDTSNPYQFRAFVDEPGQNSSPRLNPVDLTTPGQSTLHLQSNPIPGADPEWQLSESFPNSASFEAARTNGTYRFSLNGPSDGTKTVDLTLTGNNYPPVPKLQDLNLLQQINPVDGFFIYWDPLSDGTTNDFVQLEVLNGNGDVVFASPPQGSIDAPQATDMYPSQFVPPFTLFANETYTVVLRFERTVVRNTNDYPGVLGYAGYARQTTAQIKTAISPNLFPIVNSDRNERVGGFASDGQNYLMGVNVDGSSNAVQFVSSFGEPLGSPFGVGFGSEPPRIAFDGTNYLAVWVDNITGGNSALSVINAVFISPYGYTIGDPFAVTGTGAGRVLDSVVFGAGHYLLVWQETGATTGPDILGALVDAVPPFQISGGRPIAPLFQNPNPPPLPQSFVIGGSNLAEVDAVASFDGANFFVAFQRPVNNTANGFHVFGRLISPSGVLSNGVQLSQIASARHNPMAIGLGSGSYFVTWSRDVSSGSPAAAAWDLFGRLVGFDGQPVGGEIAVSVAAGDQVLPTVAFDGNTFLVGWIDTDPNDLTGNKDRARGRFFVSDGRAVDVPFVLLEDIFGRPPATIGLSFGNGKFLGLATYAYSSYTLGQFSGYFSGDIFGSFITPVSAAIYEQPHDLIVKAGNPATLTVGASGNEPLTYQWRKNGINLSGQTNFYLQFDTTSPLNSAVYSVVVSNQFGLVISSNATLSVLNPPSFSLFPVDQHSTLGGTATFTAGAFGDGPLSYQWSHNGRIIPGATSTNLVLTNIQPRDLGAYNITVENPVAAVDSQLVYLSISGLELGLNDTFASRGSTNSYEGIGTGNNANATKQTGEPNHAGRRGGHSVWYSWIAPANGVATFSTEGSAFDTVIAVYTGSAVNALVSKASDDDSAGFGTSLVRFNAIINTEYLIAVDGYDGASGDIVLSWSMKSGVAPVAEIAQQPVSQSRPPGTNVTFVVVATSPGSLFYQWYFKGDILSGQTGSSLTVSNIQSENAGGYYVVVSSGGASIVSATAYLEISSTSGVNSDDKFADQLLDSSGNPITSSPRKDTFASVSAGVLGTQILNNIGSGKEIGEPNHAGITGGSSRWFSIRPESDGVLVIDTIGSDVDTVLAVYTGNSLFNLQLVASDNNGAPDGIRSLVRFNATAGTFYRVAVDTVNGVQGHINLNYSLGSVPAFTSSPDSPQVVAAGTNLTLAAAAAGTPAPEFQWRFNGTIISGATNPVLTVNNFQALNAGTYSVSASNSAGSTNANAIVTVNLPTFPPRVSITSPGSNAVFRTGANIVIAVSASDFNDSPVEHVEFYRGTTKVGQSTTRPYSITFSNAALGSYILTARAFDFIGGSNQSLALPIRVVVPDTVKPTVTITAPLAAARLSNAVVTVTGKATDNSQVTKVEGQLNDGPFVSFTGTTNWTNGFTLIPGTNTFRVRSFDLLGNISLTNTRSVFYVVTNAITLATDGSGTITGLNNRQVLELGRGYKLTATPKPGNLFSNWTSAAGVFSTNPVLNFLMSPDLALTAHFVTNPFILAKGLYNGLVLDTNNVAFTNAGMINLTVTDKGVFSGKLLLAGASLNLAGGFGVDGTATLRLTRTGKPTLTNQLILNLVSNESLGGSVSDGAFIAAIQADKAVYAATNPAPYTNLYTLIIPASGEVAGDGVGTVKVSPAGIVTFAGTLADGTAVSQSVPVSRAGWWPLYVPLYAGKGMLVSWAQFDTNGTRSIEGDAVWAKQAQPGKYYTNGFLLKSTVLGGGYVAPKTGPTNLVLAATNLTATLSGGNLAGITNAVVLTNNNVIVVTGTNGLKLTITPSSGMVSGSFTHPVTKAVTPIKAVVQQAETNIHGFFLGTNASGQIIVQP